MLWTNPSKQIASSIKFIMQVDEKSMNGMLKLEDSVSNELISNHSAADGWELRPNLESVVQKMCTSMVGSDYCASCIIHLLHPSKTTFLVQIS